MHLSNLVQVLRYGLSHPMKSYRSLQRTLLDYDQRDEKTRRFMEGFSSSGVRPPADFSFDPRYEGNSNRLWDYFQAHRTGPGIYKWTQYFEIYERHFAKFVGRSPHVVEVGVYSGGSLDMWHHYFGEGCRVTGIDIEEACRSYETEKTRIFIGDQANRDFWRRFRDETPPVDILIDDGGHSPEQQRITLEEMLPHLNPGGVFLCEDVHGVENNFASYAYRLADHLNAPSFPDLRDGELGIVARSQPFQQQIHSIHNYPFAIAFERNLHPVTEFHCPRHGTEWQPFCGPVPKNSTSPA